MKAGGGLGNGKLARIVDCCGDTDPEKEVHQWLSEEVALYDLRGSTVISNSLWSS
jgi:hypothetical protein